MPELPVLSTDPQELLLLLLADIRHLLPFNQFTASLLEGGIESIVAKIASYDGRVIVVKFAPNRFTGNANDPDLDFLDLYRQELEIANECAAHDIPTCRIDEVFVSPLGVPAMIMGHVDHDRSSPSGASLGLLTRALHNMPTRRETTVAMRGMSAAEMLTRLTLERLQVVAGRTGRVVWTPGAQELLTILQPLDDNSSLLHMDLRSANVLCAEGKPLALIDWDNAVVANSLLEIARVMEYDLLDGGFIRAYGNESVMAGLKTATGLACRLYTAAMMAVLFLCEIPDEQLAWERMARLEAVLTDLRRAIGTGSAK